MVSGECERNESSCENRTCTLATVPAVEGDSDSDAGSGTDGESESETHEYEETAAAADPGREETAFAGVCAGLIPPLCGWGGA